MPRLFLFLLNERERLADHILTTFQTISYSTGDNVGSIPGPKTKSALIKAFLIELNKQYNKKLVVDGKWGPKTRAAIVTVKKGAKGKLTWILQGALFTEGYSPESLDSIFGKGTETALANQKARDISVDRKAGKATFTELVAG
ncbi:peptidoglycan-binding domain-containing protein [Peribacillus frigoritolerans]|uniref:peptidoglycan-binding domain-containing protein n=1 Tax=Peribacillus frigoritolerans TaxID=450367 RepID=UPI00362A415E